MHECIIYLFIICSALSGPDSKSHIFRSAFDVFHFQEPFLMVDILVKFFYLKQSLKHKHTFVSTCCSAYRVVCTLHTVCKYLGWIYIFWHFGLARSAITCPQDQIASKNLLWWMAAVRIESHSLSSIHIFKYYPRVQQCTIDNIIVIITKWYSLEIYIGIRIS